MTPKEIQTKLTAACQGFRMLIGNPQARSTTEAKKYRQLTYTCLQNLNTRWPETVNFPTTECPGGIMTNVRFPT